MERARLLHRFIEIANLLQSGNYGNLFSFIAVMQGLAVPQVRPDPQLLRVNCLFRSIDAWFCFILKSALSYMRVSAILYVLPEYMFVYYEFVQNN